MTMRQITVLALLTTLMFAAAPGIAEAALINNAVRAGLNTLNDTNGDQYIPAGDGSTFQVGDAFNTVLLFNNITNSSFLNTPLPTATGASPYELSAVASLTITAVNPAASPSTPGNVDLLLSGSISVYETQNPANFVNFTTDTFGGAVAKVLAGTNVLNLSTDFYQQMDAPPGVGGVPAFPGVTADAGFSVTSNPAGLPIAPGATGITHPTYNTNNIVTTFHDLTARVQLFVNQGTNIGEFPLFTDTTVQFTSRQTVIPEPLSVLTWLGLCGAAASAVVCRRQWRGRHVRA
jgi:hypothetical protein